MSSWGHHLAGKLKAGGLMASFIWDGLCELSMSKVAVILACQHLCLWVRLSLYYSCEWCVVAFQNSGHTWCYQGRLLCFRSLIFNLNWKQLTVVVKEKNHLNKQGFPSQSLFQTYASAFVQKLRQTNPNQTKYNVHTHKILSFL